jgi:hypothetical protein
MSLIGASVGAGLKAYPLTHEGNEEGREDVQRRGSIRQSKARREIVQIEGSMFGSCMAGINRESEFEVAFQTLAAS